jgi:hypothetical protein
LQQVFEKFLLKFSSFSKSRDFFNDFKKDSFKRLDKANANGIICKHPDFSGLYAEDLNLPFTKSDFSLPDSLP